MRVQVCGWTGEVVTTTRHTHTHMWLLILCESLIFETAAARGRFRIAVGASCGCYGRQEKTTEGFLLSAAPPRTRHFFREEASVRKKTRYVPAITACRQHKLQHAKKPSVRNKRSRGSIGIDSTRE